MAETMKMDARDGCNEIKRFSYEMTSRLSDYVGFHVRIVPHVIGFLSIVFNQLLFIETARACDRLLTVTNKMRSIGFYKKLLTS